MRKAEIGYSQLNFGNSINVSKFQPRLLGDSIDIVIEPIYSSPFSGSYNNRDTNAPLIKQRFLKSNILIFENKIDLYQFMIERLDSIQIDTLELLELHDRRGGVNQGDNNYSEEGKAII